MASHCSGNGAQRDGLHRGYRGFPGGSEVKASACNAGDLSSIPGLGRSPGEGNGREISCVCVCLFTM